MIYHNIIIILLSITSLLLLISQFYKNKKSDNTLSELDIYLASKKVDDDLWKQINFTVIRYAIWKDQVRKCYTPDNLLPINQICFEDEGVLSMCFKTNIFFTEEEALLSLKRRKDYEEAVRKREVTELKLIPWRGGYKII